MFVGPDAVQRDVIRLISRRVMVDRGCSDDDIPCVACVTPVDCRGPRLAPYGYARSTRFGTWLYSRRSV